MDKAEATSIDAGKKVLIIPVADKNRREKLKRFLHSTRGSWDLFPRVSHLESNSTKLHLYLGCAPPLTAKQPSTHGFNLTVADIHHVPGTDWVPLKSWIHGNNIIFENRIWEFTGKQYPRVNDSFASVFRSIMSALVKFHRQDIFSFRLTAEDYDNDRTGVFIRSASEGGTAPDVLLVCNNPLLNASSTAILNSSKQDLKDLGELMQHIVDVCHSPSVYSPPPPEFTSTVTLFKHSQSANSLKKLRELEVLLLGSSLFWTSDDRIWMIGTFYSFGRKNKFLLNTWHHHSNIKNWTKSIHRPVELENVDEISSQQIIDHHVYRLFSMLMFKGWTYNPNEEAYGDYQTPENVIKFFRNVLAHYNDALQKVNDYSLPVNPVDNDWEAATEPPFPSSLQSLSLVSIPPVEIPPLGPDNMIKLLSKKKLDPKDIEDGLRSDLPGVLPAIYQHVALNSQDFVLSGPFYDLLVKLLHLDEEEFKLS